MAIHGNARASPLVRSPAAACVGRLPPAPPRGFARAELRDPVRLVRINLAQLTR